MAARKKPKAEHGENTGTKHAPWKPGESGNPNGRPKGSVNLLQRIREQLLKVDPKMRAETADRVARAYVLAMRKGSIKHIQDFLDRDEGKPTQPIDLSGSLDLQPLSPEEAIQRQAAALERASLVRPVLAVAQPKSNGHNGNGSNGHR